MNKKSNPISLFAVIAVVGLLASFLTGNFEIGSYFESLEVTNIEVLLDYLNIGLGFLALGSIVVYFIMRTAWGKEANWLEQVLRDKHEKDQQDS